MKRIQNKYWIYRHWTQEEDKLLIRLYNKKSNKEIGNIFNRSPEKIGRRAKILGIKKYRNVWLDNIKRGIENSKKEIY